MAAKLAELMVTLEGLSLADLRLVLRFAEEVQRLDKYLPNLYQLIRG